MGLVPRNTDYVVTRIYVAVEAVSRANSCHRFSIDSHVVVDMCAERLDHPKDVETSLGCHCGRRCRLRRCSSSYVEVSSPSVLEQYLKLNPEYRRVPATAASARVEDVLQVRGDTQP